MKFYIEPHPNAHLDSCKDCMVLRSDDGKIHAHSKRYRTLKAIKNKMEKFLQAIT